MIKGSVNDEIRIRSLKEAVRILKGLVRHLMKNDPDNYVKAQLRDVDAQMRAVENIENEAKFVGLDKEKL